MSFSKRLTFLEFNILDDENFYYWQLYFFDLSFYIIISILLMSIIYGIIVEVLRVGRIKKNRQINAIKTKCFICGVEKGEFSNL